MNVQSNEPATVAFQGEETITPKRMNRKSSVFLERIKACCQKSEDRVGSLPIAFGNQTISKTPETHGFAVLASQRVCLYRMQS